MHGAAQRSETGEPAGRDLEDEHAAVLAQTGRILRKISRDPGSTRLTGELIELEAQLSALTVAYEAHAARMFCASELVELGRRLEREAQAARAAAVPRPRRTRRAGQPPLMVLAGS